ncbi:MAG: M24 family metallopeptidase [Actinobacteria bacterium]|nr:M24 family metallopeptidase [Actinomycetota bacterium]
MVAGRCFIAGNAQQWQVDLYEQVQLAQASSRAALSHGVALSAVVEPTVNQFQSSGYLDKFGHGLGHGVGLEIHEDPFLSAKSPATLERGTVVTVEPGLYLAGQGGVRIEDTVVVTETGYKNLTKFPYELLQIN